MKLEPSQLAPPLAAPPLAASADHGLLAAARWAKGPDVFAGRFAIEREAGVGGMGIVYRALDQVSGDAVALKLLRKSDRATLRRFDAEAEALERLRHPAIVRYIAHGTGDDGQRYLAMEWVDGETLGARLRRGSLDVREVVMLGRRIAEGLESAHALGILHRDIKPSNVLLPGRDVEQAKIADFGLARSIAPRETANATTTGIIVGTVGYMAPEQAHGVSDLDGRADLFSLGCLLFRCLADVDAFDGSRALTALAKLLLHEPPRVTELRPDVPAALDQLVARLLAKDREERPRSAAEVRAALQGIDEDVPSAAGAPPAEARGPELEPGDVFGRYVIESRLGAGGMGELFRAHDTVLRRSVALKLLRGARAPASTSNLVREARAAAALNHPNVVTIHDVGEHEGVPFLAMECVKGKPLRAYIGDPSIDIHRRIGWMIEAARGLSAAHHAGLVHGDVKPDNVMVGDNGTVKVLDFGLTHAAPDRIMGTPAYMAPEQIRGEEIDGRADQFAWGVTAYELVTGRLPWRDQDAIATLASVLSQDAERVPLIEADARWANVASEVTDAILKTLRKARDQRFSTMDHLLAALEAGASRRRPSGVRMRLSAASPIRRLGWMGLVPLLVIAVIALLVRSYASERASPQNLVETANGRKPTPHAAPPATAITALPVSPTCAPAAVALHRESVNAIRQGNCRRALGILEKAGDADPLCPEVQLRMTVLGEVYWPRSRQRDQLRRTISLRGEMSERDRLLLDAWTAIVGPEPPREAEAIEILDEGMRRFPGDAEFRNLTMYRKVSFSQRAEELEALFEPATRTIELDPAYADAWLIPAEILARLGRWEEALRALDRCLEISPASMDCIEQRTSALRHLGRCDEAAEDARRWMAWDANEASAYEQLTDALSSGPASREALEEALLLRWKRLPVLAREPARLCDLAKLAIRNGDFEGALRTADALGRQATGTATVEPHLCATVASVESLLEIGSSARAASAVDRFVQREKAWVKGDSNEVPLYPTPLLFAVQLEHGGLPPARWREANDDWETSQGAGLNPFERWVLRWGPAVGTRVLAPEALRSDPRAAVRFTPTSRHHTFNIGALEAYEGRIHLYAGDAAKAAPLLEVATKSCQGLDSAALHVRAHLWLGMAKEKLGDIPRACDAYRFVSQRWGAAKPPSVTAQEADRRSRALECPR